MERFIYTVASIRNSEDEEKVISIVRSCVDAENVEASQKTSSILIMVNNLPQGKEVMERKLAYELRRAGYELILPEGTGTFIPAKKNAPKSVSLPTAIILAVVIGLFCAMLTFGVCYRQMTGYGQKDDTPEHISDLAKLDEFFRQYSYDGIKDEKFGEHLIDAYIKYSGDAYAEYYTKDELQALEDDKTGSFVGIGVGVKKATFALDGKNVTAIEIVSIYDNSPASEAGLKAGDVITHIGSKDLLKSVEELGYDAAMSMLGGEQDSYAEFVAQIKGDDGKYTQKEFKIQRKKVTSISVKGEICTTDEKVGIVTITNFDYTTPTQFTDAIDTLNEKGCEKFIFDLRDNPGGYVESIASVLSYFLDEGDVIMTVEDKNGKVTDTEKVKVRKNEHFSIEKKDIGKYKDLEFSVLVNGNTASAAELFTATVRDYKLGEIVGTKTYGKGSMQRTYMLEDYGLDGALKITTHLYFSKSHKSYHGKGIEPDHILKLSDEAKIYKGEIPHDKDNQLQKAIEILK